MSVGRLLTHGERIWPHRGCHILLRLVDPLKVDESRYAQHIQLRAKEHVVYRLMRLVSGSKNVSDVLSRTLVAGYYEPAGHPAGLAGPSFAGQGRRLSVSGVRDPGQLEPRLIDFGYVVVGLHEALGACTCAGGFR